MKNAIKVLCFTLAVIIVGTSAFLIYFKWDKSQFEYVDGTEKGTDTRTKARMLQSLQSSEEKKLRRLTPRLLRRATLPQLR